MSKQDIYLQRAAQLVITRDKITALKKEQYEFIEKSPVIHKIRHEMHEAALKENWEELLEPLKKKEELASKEVAKEINNELITLEKQLEKEIAHCYSAIAETMDEGFNNDLFELASVLKYKTKKDYTGELTIDSSHRWIVRFKPSGFLNKFYAEPAVFIITSDSLSSIDGKRIFEWNYFAKESDFKYIGITKGSDYMAGSEVIKNLLDFWNFKVHINN